MNGEALIQQIHDKHGDKYDTEDMRFIGDTGFILLYDNAKDESVEMCMNCLEPTNGVFDHVCERRPS